MTDQRPDRILVIDDEVTQRILVKEYLEEAGYVVRLSDDGRRGLKMAAVTKPDLIILDLMLPTIDGYALCACLKQAESTAHIPIILITASREPGVIERGLAAGADDFVIKPVDWEFLADRVKFVLARTRQKAVGEEAEPTGEESMTAATSELVKEEAEEAARQARAEVEQAKARAHCEIERAEESFRQKLAASQAEHAGQLREMKSRADLERVSMERQHAAELDRVRAEAAQEVDEARLAARLELERSEKQSADEMKALRAEAQAFKEQLARHIALLAADEEKHKAEVQAVRVQARREAEALRLSYEERLASAAARQDQKLAQMAHLEEVERRHDAEIISLRAASDAEIESMRREFEQRLAAAAEQHMHELASAHAKTKTMASEVSGMAQPLADAEVQASERIRSVWELVRAASVAHLDLAAEAAAALKSAGAQDGVSPSHPDLQKAVASIRALAGSLGKLRLLSQVMSGTAEFRDTAFDLAKLVSDAAVSVRDLAAARQVSFEVKVPGQPVGLYGDHSRLSYALISILVNAIRHTPAGGGVTLTLKSDAGGEALLEIADTGVGIAPALLRGLQDCLDRPGQAVSGRVDGVGFGLPIATALVRQHGGRVEIESGLGRGTLVAVALPIGSRRQAGADDTISKTRRLAG